MCVWNLLPNNGRHLQSNYLETGLHATILLNSILRTGWGLWTGFIWLRIGTLHGYGHVSLSLARAQCIELDNIGTRYTTSRKVVGSISDEVIGFFNLRNPSSRTMALGSTQPLTEMSTRNLRESKGRPVRKPDDLTAICEPIV
jgi:hypothetical protein